MFSSNVIIIKHCLHVCLKHISSIKPHKLSDKTSLWLLDAKISFCLLNVDKSTNDKWLKAQHQFTANTRW